MVFVFSYCPWLVYPYVYTNGQPYYDTIANTTNSSNTNNNNNMTSSNANDANANYWSFYMRCDVSQDGETRDNLLYLCDTRVYIIDPVCAIPYVASFWSQAYSYGILSCPTGYIQTLSSNITSVLSPNLVALSSGMMILSFIIFAFLLMIFTCCIP